MAVVRLTSLRARFLTLLVLGGSLVASVGLWATYSITVGHFEAQLVERGKLLAGSLNHTAMVTTSPMQLQHVVDELSLSPHIESIIVAAGEPPEILASSDGTWHGTRLDRLPDRHLREHLFKVMAKGEFGHHFDDARESLILSAPLEPHLTSQQGHDASAMPGRAAPEQATMEPGTAHEPGTMHERGSAPNIESGTAGDPLPYRGVIMLFLDAKSASAALSQILWLLCIALIAAVLITIGIAYVLVDRKILTRLNVIRGAMIRQRSGDGAVRVPVIANDELSDLGRAFNNMIDRIDAETEKREDLVKELKDSEELFRSVVNNAPTKIHIKDVEGRYVLVNSEAARLFGVTDEEARGKTTHEVFPDKQADAFSAHDRAVLETGETVAEEEKWLREGRVHTFFTVKFPILDSSGGIRGTGAIGTDITELKRTQEELERLKQQNELILRSAGEGIYGLDTQGRTTFANPAAAKMIGWNAEELIGKPQHAILHHTKPDGSPYPREECPIYAAFKDGSVHHVADEVFWRKDGSSFPVEYVSAPIRERGEIIGAVVVFRDISDQKRAQDAVFAAKEQAEQANRTKSEFLANMSHELRTPLNAIIGFSEIIKDETFGPVGSTRYREYANDINQSGQHLLALINDILDLSKIESGTGELHEENVEFSEIANAILKLVMGLARAGNVELELDMSNNILRLRADERKMKQILLNLLSNSIKFTPAGGKVTLKIWSRADSGCVFQVIDTGIGIAFEDIPKALAPFQQIHSGLDRKHEGTGLGLPLTKSLVEMHGGSLDLQSKVGVGTTVTVRIPAERIVGSPRDSKAAGTVVRKAG